MSAGKSLKEQNAWLIRAVLVIHALAFAYVVFQPLPITQLSGPEALQKMQNFLAPGSIALGLIALTRLVLLGLIPAQMRDRLIHWRWINPLPGARAFTKIGPADQRVDMKKLKKAHGRLPVDPDEQGRLFYSIYRKHSADVGVLDAHKSYLAARDIGTINLILLILLVPLAGLFTQDHGRVAVYAGCLFAAYALMCLAAQVYAARLVQNTLAVASH
ncbi:hypothetical protein ASD45_20970 [Pseudolabrys sp. Root1462]|jgi:hypothetical protein|uniref:hypothetical protein n=1 Tax=Pseudolabrys sp. Root1462 TaxID=1736466 RepID=UPI000702EA03|nr:hypothetical protein [Pseudolabrys sp. Root1462]KQY97180.1 hypothetical protein ASD45_20970 [Pseudolabrys sp. Root1462]